MIFDSNFLKELYSINHQHQSWHCLQMNFGRMLTSMILSIFSRMTDVFKKYNKKWLFQGWGSNCLTWVFKSCIKVPSKLHQSCVKVKNIFTPAIRRQFQYIIIFAQYANATNPPKLNRNINKGQGNVLKKCFDILEKYEQAQYNQYLLIGKSNF